MIYFIWYAGWVSIIDSIVFVYLTLALKLNTKRYNTYNRVTVKSERRREVVGRMEEGKRMK